MVTLYTITLTAVCCVAVALVIGSERRRRAAEVSWITTSTLALLAAAAATLSALAYAMSGPNDENTLSLVIGDVTQPLAVGLLAATMRRATGSPSNNTWAVYFLGLSFGVGGVTVFVSPERGLDVKLILLAAFSLIVAYTCWRGRRLVSAPGALIVGAGTLAYAVYCLGRLASLHVLSPLDPTLLSVFDRATATIVAAGAVTLAAVGVILIVRDRSGTTTALVSAEEMKNWVEALLVTSDSLTAIAISVPDVLLHRAAFGRPWATAITAAAARATLDALPAGSVVARVTPHALVALHFGATLDIDITRERIQEAYAENIPPSPPTRPPDLVVERLVISTPADIRRFARRSRGDARRATTTRGA